MKLLWCIAAAILAGLAGGCAGENALYTSSKYVPGYTPTGKTGPSPRAAAYDQQLASR